MASTDSKKSKKNKPGRAPQDRRGPTSAGAWQRSQNGAEFDLPLPSGNVARVRRPGPLEILRSGIMPDSLMPIITESIQKGQGAKIQDKIDPTSDPEMLAELLDGMDKSMLEIVVQPAIAYHRRPIESSPDKWETIPENERDLDAFVYTDEIDMDDKMYLFNFAVGGTRDLEQFREEYSASVGDVAGDSVAGDPS